MHQERNRRLLYPQFLYADPLALSRKTTPFAGQSPKVMSRKNFAISVKIPLITTKEWREISSGLHVNDESYRQREARAMSQLAVQKGKEVYV